MGKKNDPRIVIDLLQRHAEVPSPEAFCDRYVSQYAGRPLGRPAFVAPEPEPEPEPLLDLGGEPPAEATTLIDAFQDDLVGMPDDSTAAETACEGDTMPPEESQSVPDEAAFEDPTEGETRLIDSLDEPAEAFAPPEEPPSGTETASFEAVDASPDDIWGAPAEPAPAPEGHGTMVMGALKDPDAEDVNGEASKDVNGEASKEAAAAQGGKKKKKRRHR